MLIVLPEKDAVAICDSLRDKCFVFEKITAEEAAVYLDSMIGDMIDLTRVSTAKKFTFNPKASLNITPKAGFKSTINFPFSTSFSVEV